jgi:adenylate cyclase
MTPPNLGTPAEPEVRSDYRIDIEPCPRRVEVVFNGVTIADTSRALVLHETRLPTVYYLPKDDVRMDLMEPTPTRTHCPFKGNASYWNLRVGDVVSEDTVWAYEKPLSEAEPIFGHVAFYRDRMDAWYEDGVEVGLDAVSDAHGNPLVDWLVRDAWQAAGVPEIVEGLAERLRQCGTPVVRLSLLLRTLHPQVMGMAHRWEHGKDTTTDELSHQVSSEEDFLASPFVPIFAGRGGIRRRLDGETAKLDFPVLRELRDAGCTDYTAMPITFSDGQTHAITMATDSPDGFTTHTLGQIHEALPLVSRLIEVHASRRTARTLLDTYLGNKSGSRVLEGRIRRGDGEQIPAVVWWADLRDSTPLQERLPRERYLDFLNEFFESTAGSAIDAGGEVLKFIGDAVLAIFPISANPNAPFAALSAAREALARIDEFNRTRDADEPALGAAIALHLGDVHYGNIGVPGRLDFTATGPTVNEVARLEGLSKQLETAVVASGAFAARVEESLVSLGRHPLKGVGRTIEVFTLPELRAADEAS